MQSDKSRDHRLRVLVNQARIAAEEVSKSELGADPQMTMPLIVEVTSSPAKQRGRRLRKKSRTEQPHLGDL